MKLLPFASSLFFLVFASCADRSPVESDNLPQNLFEYTDEISPRWSSFENITAEKGAGGKENSGAKGHPFEYLKAGETKVLLDFEGPGIINRIWVTIADRSPEMLRALRIEMYWDGEAKPAVSAPFGDFFGVGLGQQVQFESALFSNPEGRSFNCFVQMPFRKRAKIQVTNESGKDLTMLFFDINFQKLKKWNPRYLYFHTYWSRDTATIVTKDFEILPKVSGKGRFLGTNIGVNSNPAYGEQWFGEGELKVFLDGDREWPTLVGTGTEDYVGSAWGLGEFANDYTGCLTSKNGQWTIYRYHIPDPIYFQSDAKVTIQQIGGAAKNEVIERVNKGVSLVPVTVGKPGGAIHIYEKDKQVDLNNPDLPNLWTNYYRSDDVSATAYFYLDKPTNDLPTLQPVAIRTMNLIVSK